LVSFLQRLLYTPLDEGNEFFQGSNLEITGLHTDTNVCNVIPSHAQASFNIRFNTSYTGEVLQHMMEEILDEFKLTYSKNYEFVLESTLSGDAFLSVHKPFQDFLGQVILQETGIQPIFNTSGGTSDGRFMKDVCPCIDFGLIGKRAHKSDEYVPIKDLFKLKDIYKNVINNFSRVDFSSDI
jgi:succinyl-diaminopimelate desuccinylase